ncbi:MAG TPA: hemopexin repeat-containing protein, partial [Roseiflexaceae bacterium]|nr:hemopexin repeat-containing protein [Roseiflexaceae bacterium]
MERSINLPSYAELFGKLEFKKGEEARSVYSPAAYLADLLQLLDDSFAAPGSAQNGTEPQHPPRSAESILAGRRPDILTTPLDTENTYTEMPYLDIVNEVLEHVLGGNVYEDLKKATYPFQMPFDLDNEKVKRYFHYLEARPEQLYKQFALELDPNILAREYLGLSPAEHAICTTQVSTEPEIKALYPPSDSAPWVELTSVGAFLRATGLSGQALRELLFQSLSATAKNAAGDAERTQASAFFIHHDLGGYVQLDVNEEVLVWSDSTQSIPPAWFERVGRFIRLANKIGLSFSDLDLILRSCCNNNLDSTANGDNNNRDSAAIRTIAVIKQLHDRYELPIDVVCSFFSPLNTLGIGDEKTPRDLFNRIFNVKFAPIDKMYIAGSKFISPAYATQYTPLNCSGDLLSFNNKEYRRRLGKALGISDRDIAFIVTQFRNKYATDPRSTILSTEAEIGVPALSLLHRISVLAEMLDISYAELFGLLDLLERDPSIRKVNNFDLLIEGEVQNVDCYRILEQGELPDALWLVQMLAAVAAWMQANDFSSEELNQILSGRYRSATEASNRSQKIALLDELYQQFKAVMLTADVFASDRFSARTAQVIHRVLTEPGHGLVCEKDQRLVRFDAALASTVAYKVLDQLAVIHSQDFRQLGLEQRLLDKIVANLIFKGYLNPEGEIAQARLPKQATEFVLASDFSAHTDAVFTLIHDFYTNATQAQDDQDHSGAELGEDEDALESSDDLAEDAQSDRDFGPEILAGDDPIELALFPSDLEALEELSEAERNELYDNLIFNGYIDSEGNVLQPDFFAQPENAADLKVNADLSAVATGVFTQIVQQIAQFDATPLVLDRAIFADLPLTAAEIDDLIENLRFNGYIDPANVWIDKRAMLALSVDQLSLELAFYPHRRKILEAIKAQIDALKADFYTIAQDAFGALADAAVAQQVLDRLAAEHLVNNRIAKEQAAFFLDRENVATFALAGDISAADHALIFDQIGAILGDLQRYQMPLSALEELDFDADETAELLETLTAGGYLTAALLLPEDKISYFLNVNNALEFSIRAFTDYNKDIFFILHAVAKETAAAMDEIVAQIRAQADSQAGVILNVLQDALGVEADLIKVVCGYLLRSHDLVEAWMLPILAVIGRNDTVPAEPASSAFNLLYKRLLQFSLLASKLRLSAEEAAIVWRDQDLVEKFPEQLTLPAGVDQFDALLESPDGLIYLFKGDHYWTYSAKDYTSIANGSGPLTALWDPFAGTTKTDASAGSSDTALLNPFRGVTKIDAAFVDSSGTAYLVAGNTYIYKEKASTRWAKKERAWGQINNNFANPAGIDTAFRDQEGKTYLFSGTQYIRYSGADYSQPVDEGYPLTIAGNWEREGLNAALPDQFKQSIDASFQGADEKTYLFKDHSFVASDNLSEARDIRAVWGKVRNNLQGLGQLDAAYADGAEYYFFAGDQVVVYQDSIENDGVCVREGYPRRIEAQFANLPAEFESGLEAAFKGQDGLIHLFKNGKAVAMNPDGSLASVTQIKERWGMVTNQILQTGKIDAAFVGLDGKTYLFSADQYVRYSGADYTQADQGYPRAITPDWGGLKRVDAAFVLDGKTYLFGADASYSGADGRERIVYVRYSQRDYSTHDVGYPKQPNDNWWNLPAKLVQEGAPFERIDAVFSGKDSRTYLFSGDQFIVFDNKHRWWSEPQRLDTQWGDIPFTSVDAAFVGKDGKTYIFSGQQYVRYSNSTYSKIDDRYPNRISTYWGNVVNNIAKTGRVDAALVVASTELIDGAEQRTMHTYLFSGNQYVRYKGDQYATVENGYPKYIAASLKCEPRFANLPAGFENGIDAAIADRRTIYLFKGATCHALSEAQYRVYSELGFTNPGCAFLENGALLIEEAGKWKH